MDSQDKGLLYQNKLMKELQLSKEKFETVFNLCPSAMAIRRLEDLTYVDANREWFKYTGFTAGEIIGKTASELDIIDNFLQWQEKYGPISSGTGEVNFRTKRGDTKIGTWTFNIIELGSEKYVLTSLIDVTDQKRMEEKMNQLDRLTMIGEMAAGVAHETRNPMTVVKGYLQHLRSKVGPGMQEQFDTVLLEINTVEALVADFLSLAKNKVVEQTAQQLNPIIESLYPLLLAEAVNKGVVVTLNLAPDLPPVLVSEKEIKQLVLNLTHNSLDAIPKNGSLTIATEWQAEGIILRVADTGCGIPEEVRRKIYDPFFTTKENGTGLGLPICMGIVQRHDAQIEVESEVGKGTVFTVLFPAVGLENVSLEKTMEP